MPRRNKPDHYHTMAKERGITWLEQIPKSVMQKTGWQCPKGHIWYAPYNNIQKGGGCPICNKRSHRTDDAYHNLAKDKNLGWLGPNTPERTLPTNWVCSYGHMWNASFEEIAADQHCPICGE